MEVNVMEGCGAARESESPTCAGLSIKSGARTEVCVTSVCNILYGFLQRGRVTKPWSGAVRVEFLCSFPKFDTAVYPHRTHQSPLQSLLVKSARVSFFVYQSKIDLHNLLCDFSVSLEESFQSEYRAHGKVD